MMTIEKNNKLIVAKAKKEDEFYTQLTDIEKEMYHYREHFRGKVILCNCDDPKESNFWVFFAQNFEFLGLKKLMATHYVAGGQSYKLTLDCDIDGDGRIDINDTKKEPLQGDGDFRSLECIEILKEADIVVTNPPFSLFRAYIAQLVEFEKSFIILGNMNAATCKEVFPLFTANNVWFGPSISSGDREFKVPTDYVLRTKTVRWNDNSDRFVKVNGVRWFTNLEHKRRKEDIILVNKYQGNEKLYPKYDNYDAIEVSKTQDIPRDYLGKMGVPISFLNKHNPDQFEILGLDRYIEGNSTPNKRFTIDGKEKYARIVIQRIQK